MYVIGPIYLGSNPYKVAAILQRDVCVMQHRTTIPGEEAARDEPTPSALVPYCSALPASHTLDLHSAVQGQEYREFNYIN